MTNMFFGPGFLLQMLYAFKTRKLGSFLAHGPTQENGSSLLCEVISGFHFPTKQAWIVSDWQWLLKKGILCKALPFSESLLLLHPKTMHKFIDQALRKTLSVCVCFAREWNNEMTSQSKLDPVSWIVIHGPKMRPTSFLWKGTTLKENSRTYIFQSMDGVGTESQIPQLKKGAVWKS